jgi:hypothetical protein
MSRRDRYSSTRLSPGELARAGRKYLLVNLMPGIAAVNCVKQSTFADRSRAAAGVNSDADPSFGTNPGDIRELIFPNDCVFIFASFDNDFVPTVASAQLFNITSVIFSALNTFQVR